MRRRTLLRTVGGLSLAGVAGCSADGGSDGSGEGGNADGGNGDGGNGDGGDANEVLVGPDSSLTFRPETLTVTTGTTVTWRFESANHNVCGNPAHHDAASLPDGADPFASYEGDDTFATDEVGTTFEHTFEVTGAYRYVCVPHAASGMEGTVRVEE